jgi:hypothetical protein
MKIGAILLVAVALLTPGIGVAQSNDTPAASTYQPKFAGDKAHSNAESVALGYMRTVVSAQKVYKKKHGGYAASLAALVGSGSFTRRMVDAHRGDYTALFKTKTEGYSLAMAPKQFDADHRAFFVDESGMFRGADNAQATASSPVLQ